ncbi:hypothetical protein LTR86_010750 [Recurvomyces mirabilis]|nr:hypothetical protein LTR86_010750 [Recurvomyces mirabilis]
MYSKNIFAAGALLSVVAAVPLAANKRDLVWVTETDEAVVTVPVTTTIWVNPGETAPTAVSTVQADAHTVSHYGHHTHSTSSSAPAPSAPAPSAPASSAAPSSSSSVYVAPSSSSVYVAPSSSSVYVAPASSSSVYVAATTSTSVYVAPTTSTYVAPTTSSTSQYVAPSSSASPTTAQASSSVAAAAPAAASCTNANTGNTLSGQAAVGTSYSGDLTYYQTGMGACGCTSGQSDNIVAVSESLFDQFTIAGNPNLNPLCGKQVSITGANGQAYTATIVDRCTGCKVQDLDLSQGFFNTVTNNGDGRVHNMNWSFLN